MKLGIQRTKLTGENVSRTRKWGPTDTKFGHKDGIGISEHISKFQVSSYNGSEDTAKRLFTLYISLVLFRGATADFSCLGRKSSCFWRIQDRKIFFECDKRRTLSPPSPLAPRATKLAPRATKSPRATGNPDSFDVFDIYYPQILYKETLSFLSTIQTQTICRSHVRDFHDYIFALQFISNLYQLSQIRHFIILILFACNKSINNDGFILIHL